MRGDAGPPTTISSHQLPCGLRDPMASALASTFCDLYQSSGRFSAKSLRFRFKLRQPVKISLCGNKGER
jgi:hypothetical protein